MQKSFVRKTWRKETAWDIERRREKAYNIKMILGPKETEREAVGWIHLAQTKDNWWSLVNTVMNTRIP
jgi:hypothetical protein